MPSQPLAMVITNIFPPVAGVGTLRTVALCRRLVQRGWKVVVITARPRSGDTRDEASVRELPRALRIERAWAPDLPRFAARLIRGRWPAAAGGRDKARASRSSGAPAARGSPGPGRMALDWLSWWLHMPDGVTGWFAPAVWAGLRAGLRRRPHVIYSSAPVWTSHLVGATLSCLLRAPLLTDFRDPWCGSAWNRAPYAAHERANNFLERLVVRRAKQITCAWDGIRRHLATRYPEREADIQTILNGFDPDEMDAVAPARLDDSRCVLLHAGTFYGPRSPLPIFDGLRQLQATRPEAARGLLVVLVGSPAYDGKPLEALAQERGIGPLVRVLPWMPRRQALALLKGADIAMLFGQSGSEAMASVPAKTYEYIGAAKSILAVGTGGEARDLMRRGGCRVWAVDAQDAAGIASALEQIAAEHARHGLEPPCNGRARDTFTWSATADRLITVLQAVSEQRASPENLRPEGG
ncbi:MAG TPA: hypothetical protein VNA25_05425 [Phycisphaerae bacterium]|nr:hypothetical protein [Phycisphaerae bacterium]